MKRTLRKLVDLQLLIGADSEASDLDFKEFFNPVLPENRIESAKDVAALANALGGHIVIGVNTELGGTRCTGLRGLANKEAFAIAKCFEEQTKERCRPSPLMTAHLVSLDADASVVVIEVEASPIAPIGVSVRQAGGGKLVDEAYVFPTRVGSQTRYLSPEQFGVYESMTARRNAALLQAIPDDQKVDMELRWVLDRNHGPKAVDLLTQRVSLFEVKVTENVARFQMRDDGANLVSIPLDDIASIWRGFPHPGPWLVSLKGVLRPVDNKLQYWASR